MSQQQQRGRGRRDVQRQHSDETSDLSFMPVAFEPQEPTGGGDARNHGGRGGVGGPTGGGNWYRGDGERGRGRGRPQWPRGPAGQSAITYQTPYQSSQAPVRSKSTSHPIPYQSQSQNFNVSQSRSQHPTQSPPPWQLMSQSRQIPIVPPQLEKKATGNFSDRLRNTVYSPSDRTSVGLDDRTLLLQERQRLHNQQRAPTSTIPKPRIHNPQSPPIDLQSSIRKSENFELPQFDISETTKDNENVEANVEGKVEVNIVDDSRLVMDLQNLHVGIPTIQLSDSKPRDWNFDTTQKSRWSEGLFDELSPPGLPRPEEIWPQFLEDHRFGVGFSRRESKSDAKLDIGKIPVKDLHKYRLDQFYTTTEVCLIEFVVADIMQDFENDPPAQLLPQHIQQRSHDGAVFVTHHDKRHSSAYNGKNEKKKGRKRKCRGARLQARAEKKRLKSGSDQMSVDVDAGMDEHNDEGGDGREDEEGESMDLDS